MLLRVPHDGAPFFYASKRVIGWRGVSSLTGGRVEPSAADYVPEDVHRANDKALSDEMLAKIRADGTSAPADLQDANGHRSTCPRLTIESTWTTSSAR